MIVERATTNDLHDLLELMQNQFVEHRIEVETGQLEAVIRQLLTRDGLGFVLVAKQNNRLPGLATISFAWTLEHGGRSAGLDELYVLPQHRNTGIGSALQVVFHTSPQRCTLTPMASSIAALVARALSAVSAEVP